jgi:hypothetical protein
VCGELLIFDTNQQFATHRLTSFRLSGGFGLISDLRALKGLHRAEVVEQARTVDGGVIPARHRLRTVEPRHPIALKIMRMNV